MISVEEAIKILERVPTNPEIEEVPINQALNRILGQDVVSTINMPPFHKAAMDGFAIHSDDTSDRYQIVEIIPAGYVPQKEIKLGQCAKIMTGGMLPEGSDRVIKKEVTEEEDGYVKIVGKDDRVNVCFLGEDIKIGDKVLAKGAIIRPQEIGVLASMGMISVRVYKKPKVGIIATGSELVKPGWPLPKGQIYDSNTFSLSAQVLEAGAVVKSSKTAGDSQKDIQGTIKKLLDSCDMVLISGGVSVGDFDYVPNILEELGVELHFAKVAVKPGKPTVFGTQKGVVVFGVPGNPVSTFVIFEIFIKPLLFRMMGHEFRPKTIQGVLRQKISRRRTERSAYYPVRYSVGGVELLSYHGSAHIHALTKANGLICVPRGEKGISAGSIVNVRQI